MTRTLTEILKDVDKCYHTLLLGVVKEEFIKNKEFYSENHFQFGIEHIQKKEEILKELEERNLKNMLDAQNKTL